MIFDGLDEWNGKAEGFSIFRWDKTLHNPIWWVASWKSKQVNIRFQPNIHLFFCVKSANPVARQVKHTRFSLTYLTFQKKSRQKKIFMCFKPTQYLILDKIPDG